MNASGCREKPNLLLFVFIFLSFLYHSSRINKLERRAEEFTKINIKIGYFIASQRARNLHKLSFVFGASVSAEHKLFVILSDSPIQKQQTAVPNHILRVSCQSNDPQI